MASWTPGHRLLPLNFRELQPDSFSCSWIGLSDSGKDFSRHGILGPSGEPEQEQSHTSVLTPGNQTKPDADGYLPA